MVESKRGHSAALGGGQGAEHQAVDLEDIVPAPAQGLHKPECRTLIAAPIPCREYEASHCQPASMTASIIICTIASASARDRPISRRSSFHR